MNKCSIESGLLNRREFLKVSALTGVGFIANPSGVLPVASPKQKGISRIVIATDDAVRAGVNSFHEEPVVRLLDRAIEEFFQVERAVTAWKKLVTPSDVVGIKVNCLAGRGISTNTVLVNAIIEKLLEAGVPDDRIIIWDRMNSDLEDAGFTISTVSREPRCFGNDAAGYESELTIHNSIGSLLSKALTQYCSVIINVPVLKDHGIVGFTGAMKNFFGAIHNPNKYHMNLGDPYIPDLCSLPVIRKKTRLIIYDALNSQYEGGPPYMPQWRWNFNSIIVGTDPVAIDYTGWQLIETERKKKGLPTLKAAGREPTYIATAADAAHNLGTNNPDNIKVINV